MTIVHIVLAKFKAEATAGDGFDKLKAECLKFQETDEIKATYKEMKWGPPVYADRAKGYEYGLYSVFEDKAAYEKYRDLPLHRKFLQEHVMPNIEGELEMGVEETK